MDTPGMTIENASEATPPGLKTVGRNQMDLNLFEGTHFRLVWKAKRTTTILGSVFPAKGLVSAKQMGHA